jgi:hypothetical protein
VDDFKRSKLTCCTGPAESFTHFELADVMMTMTVIIA